MDSLKQSLSACWHSVALSCNVDSLTEGLSHLGQSLGLAGLVGDVGGGTAAGQEYELRGRRLRVVRQLGEGGYSFVYLVRQVPSSSGGGGSSSGALAAPAAAGAGSAQLFALKRVLCGSEEQLREAQHEVAVMRRLHHPCLLRLLDAATQQQRAPDGTARHAVLMLFPVYDGGNLFDFVQHLRQHRQRHLRGAAAAERRVAQLQELATHLRIFLQVCAALHAMHSQDPPQAHRDVKPQNVLLRRRQDAQQDEEGSKGAAAAPGAQAVGGAAAGAGWKPGAPYDPVPPLVPPSVHQDEQRHEQQQQHQGHHQQQQRAAGSAGWAAGEWQNGGSDGAGAGTSAAASAAAAYRAAGAGAPTCAAAGEPASQPPEHDSQGQGEAPWWEERLPGWRREHEAVLMDFGSTRVAHVEVRNRREAMAAQEDAERQCTAPYRAPELWDVPSSCTIDGERVDTWSLGCLLYFCLCGQSPFERAVGETGGSLMLAVVNGRLSWPTEAADLPESVKALVARCLDTDPSTRPRVAEVARAADRILASLLA